MIEVDGMLTSLQQTLDPVSQFTAVPRQLLRLYPFQFHKLLIGTLYEMEVEQRVKARTRAAELQASAEL